ncbi:unnamed protein product [Rotaria socialis]|uniref:Reverse transcriptase domain-containing protein n=1 Tax=Rotaria socialis TaxID=392032 RepID=A0A820VB16_9BILA|nr:unnamed protein product [Rotaria socialis]CAF3440264.1 unnamed protein product [Rotaria socialis]CAF4478389.1 unnamed protein product [Rotaria socialis]CAF4498633.1 unnamed protein product [Rotaria socialis]
MLTETLPPVIQSIQTLNHLIQETSKIITNDKERQQNEITHNAINVTLSAINKRLLLLTDNQMKLKSLMERENELLCLSTHITDIDILLSTHTPQIIILTGVGSQVNNLPKISGYYWISQNGANSFGGVAFLLHDTIKAKTINQKLDFIIIELNIQPKPILLGAIYIPPNKTIPQSLLDLYVNEPFFIFGDFNAKHTDWLCNTNNANGVQLKNWLDKTGCEMIHPTQPTSKRSSSIIDFGITYNASGWKVEVIKEGTSDHYPILLQAPFSTGVNKYFRKTHWKVFTYFLKCIFPYFNSLAYNYDAETFLELFSSFLSSAWDKASHFIPIKRYRPPWPPFLTQLERIVNKTRKKYRKRKNYSNLTEYLYWKHLYYNEKNTYIQKKMENQLAYISQENNIWKYVHPTFHPYTPSFKGLTTDNKIVKDHNEIVNTLADHYEKHFEAPTINPNNPFHIDATQSYNEFIQLTNIPLESITLEEVEKSWKASKRKKSTDTQGLSAFLLHQLPSEYLQTITIAFNKIALKGDVISSSKHAKVVCLSKDGFYPRVDKLRPISLLSNLGKCFERIIHARILKWCTEKGIFVDEQSGFTSERRLQTRIMSLVEDLRLTTAANNRPSLVIFVDFMSAFDRMWHPALLSTLLKLEMPTPLLKWIIQWLNGRTMSIHVGEAISRTINISVGTPQGSILAATLFRLHIHFLPSVFKNIVCHLFADDLALIIPGTIEKTFSKNIATIEGQATNTMKLLEEYADVMILPVNVNKTKALLVHNIVVPPYPRVKYKNQDVEFVKRFKYLGVDITTKLGWGIYISKRIQTIRKIYHALRIIFNKIPITLRELRRKLFFAFTLPHIIWLFSCWFFYTEHQQNTIEHVLCSGLRLTHKLNFWNDLTVYTLAREYTINDYLYKYWLKFFKHLETSTEANQYQLTYISYLA